MTLTFYPTSSRCCSRERFLLTRVELVTLIEAFSGRMLFVKVVSFAFKGIVVGLFDCEMEEEEGTYVVEEFATQNRSY